MIEPPFPDDSRPRKIIHIDMDAYASVEQRDNSEFRGKPIAVGHGEARGSALARSAPSPCFALCLGHRLVLRDHGCLRPDHEPAIFPTFISVSVPVSSRWQCMSLEGHLEAGTISDSGVCSIEPDRNIERLPDMVPEPPYSDRSKVFITRKSDSDWNYQLKVIGVERLCLCHVCLHQGIDPSMFGVPDQVLVLLDMHRHPFPRPSLLLLSLRVLTAEVA